MSETLMNVSNPYDGERRPGTVGFPLPGVELRLADGTDEVQLRGPNVLREYWNRPDATADAFDGGWFRSGDIGAFDDDGYLRIVGRSKELIISGGYNVYPREVEDVLRTHPGVADAAVVGVPDPTWGERVTAFVEASGVLRAGAARPGRRPARPVQAAEGGRARRRAAAQRDGQGRQGRPGGVNRAAQVAVGW
jgi:malonyl-CoA/methylmalonyl-CoA synthetase